MVEAYLKANNLFRDFTNKDQDPEFSEVNCHHEKFFDYEANFCLCDAFKQGS